MSNWLLSVTVAAGVLITPIGANAMSLREAIDTAVKTNPRIAAAQASRRATDKVLDQATGRYFPEVDLSADFGAERVDRPEGFGPLVNDRWRNRRKASINIRQILFDGWDRANDVYQSQARISAAAQKVMARSETIALNVVEAYIDAVRHDHLIKLANANVNRHRKLLTLVQARVEGGKNSEGDLNQTRERLEAAKALVAQIKIARNTAYAKFKEAVGVSPRRLGKVDLPRLGYRTSDGAVRMAIDKNPRLAALRAEVDVAGFRKDQFKSSLYPIVALEGSASRGEDLDGTPGRSNEVRGMVTMRWRLFDGGIREARVAELTEREYEKVAEYDTLVRSVTEQIESAWTRVVDGRVQVKALTNQLKQTQRVLAAYRREYEADKRSLLDVLDAENSRFASEFELSNVRAIRRFSAYQLIASTGRLLHTFKVEKPAGTHDAPSDVRIFSKKNLRRAFSIPSLRQD